MEAVPHLRKFVLAGTIATVAALGSSATAYADGCPNAPSSVQQYVECVPSASGGSPTAGTTKKQPIPKPIEQKIDSQGGDDTQALKDVVSSGNSTPTSTPTKVHKVTVKPKNTTKNNASQGSSEKSIVSDAATRKTNPLAASVGVITGGSDGRLIALIALMVAVTALVVFSALRRRRVTR
jgi:protein involved in ribonucleotide reduction